MKKPGEWIATFGPSLNVSRVHVEANPVLDLVEVRTIGLDGELTNIFFFDRVEGAGLKQRLAAALDKLEEGVCSTRFEAVIDLRGDWKIYDHETQRMLELHFFYGFRSESLAKKCAAQLNRQQDHKRDPLDAA